MIGIVKSLWSYHSFVLGSVKREFQTKYRNSMLGVAWNVINPLSMIVVYTVIFSQVMKARMPGVDGGYSYSIYLCAGVLTWGLFTEIVGRGQNVFIENANLLKKLSFPRLTLPLIVVFNALLSFTIVFGIFLIFLGLTGNFPGVAILGVVPLLILEIFFAVGLGMVLGVLNVFFRDVGQFFGIFLQFWFWLTPIVYSVNILPESLKPLMAMNPMTSVIGGYQIIFVTHQFPHWADLLFPSLLAAVLSLLGFNLFRKHVGEMVDEL